ncbi:MAG: glycosyltransferase [Verrucomicrobiae bacterium]|nr:glycosyltransferase [Verrucomicrobiae bacterium]
MQHTLSIITVTLNEAEHIARLQQSIQQMQKPDHVSIETILIDGGSTDATVEIATQSGYSNVVILPGATIPTCRNRGLKEANGDWIAFVDGDCELASNWLRKATPYLESEPPCLIGWPVLPPENGTWIQKAWHMHWLYKNQQVIRGKDITKDAFRLITTRNMLLRREVSEALNGFDEKLPTGEDTDFVLRAYLNDIRVIASPSLKVIHHGEPATLCEFFRQQLWHANRNSYRKIIEATGGKIGGNAPKFTLAFLCSSALALLGLLSIIFTSNILSLMLLLPIIMVTLGPALLIGYRAKHLGAVIPLTIIYTLYGLARSVDMLGLNKHKKSWK